MERVRGLVGKLNLKSDSLYGLLGPPHLASAHNGEAGQARSSTFRSMAPARAAECYDTTMAKSWVVQYRTR